MTEPVRFIIITTPPDDVSERIDEVRMRACRIGGSSAALAYPPHVTLRTGLRVPVGSLSTFLDDFKRVVGKWAPFPIATDGLLCTTYENGGLKYLVGYKIKTDDTLSAFNRRLLEYADFRASDRLEFRPHLTLAFEDLDEEGFQRLGRFFDEHPGALPSGFEWRCDNVGLYRKDGDLWVPYVVFKGN